jgi:hypothetical protein
MQPRSQYGNTRFAAVYYQWLKITDPLTGNLKLVPPGGYIAGVFARVDTQRGVHKVPANEVVQGALDLEFPLSLNDQELLTSQNVMSFGSFREEEFYCGVRERFHKKANGSTLVVVLIGFFLNQMLNRCGPKSEVRLPIF